MNTGATAKASDGTDISSQIVVTVTGAGSSVDASVSGTYTITYRITHSGESATVTRTVIVKPQGP